MKCPKCSTETPGEALCCPGCKLPTPRGRSYIQNKGKRSDQENRPKRKRPKAKGKSRQVNPIAAVLVVIAAVVFFGIGSYLALTFLGDTTAEDPGALQLTLDKVRKLPSNREGSTVEDILEEEVEKSRDEGRLLEAQGWDIRQIEGKRFQVTFTYQEKGNIQRKAEWKVDLVNNTFSPQTELAATIYNK
jgi:hypothetical protein